MNFSINIKVPRFGIKECKMGLQKNQEVEEVNNLRQRLTDSRGTDE